LGSGTKPREVNELLDEHKKLKDVVGKMGKANLGKGNEITNMARNPN
jgi:signal recognition particle GTPase